MDSPFNAGEQALRALQALPALPALSALPSVDHVSVSDLRVTCSTVQLYSSPESISYQLLTKRRYIS